MIWMADMFVHSDVKPNVFKTCWDRITLNIFNCPGF